MPTVLRIGPHRFLFYASDFQEPCRIHVRRDDMMAKFWILPVRLAANLGFSARELRDIEKRVKEHEDDIERRWNEFFGHS